MRLEEFLKAGLISMRRRVVAISSLMMAGMVERADVAALKDGQSAMEPCRIDEPAITWPSVKDLSTLPGTLRL